MADVSILARLQDAIVAVLGGLTFAAGPQGQTPTVYGLKAATDLLAKLPAVLVTVDGMADTPSSEPFNFRVLKYGYGVAVLIVDHSSRLQQDQDLYSQWREKAELALMTPALNGVPELWRTGIEGDERIQTELKKIQLPKLIGMGSGFVVRCYILRNRY